MNYRVICYDSELDEMEAVAEFLDFSDALSYCKDCFRAYVENINTGEKVYEVNDWYI